MNFNYQKELVRIWENAVKLYHNGNTSADTFPIQHDLPFLNKIGLNKMDIFDYVEDWVCEGTPDLGTFLLIHDLRRDFFIEEGWKSEWIAKQPYKKCSEVPLSIFLKGVAGKTKKRRITKKKKKN